MSVHVDDVEVGAVEFALIPVAMVALIVLIAIGIPIIILLRR